jgi:gamma-glutamylputrescine oxidase
MDEEINRSLWQTPLPKPLGRYTAKNLSVDTVVIGAGLTGLSAAYHLLKASPGRKVVILEAGQVGAGASSRSTGMLTPGVGQSIVSLIRRVGPGVARRLYKETLDAVLYVEQLVAQLGIDCQLRMNGQLILSPRYRRMQGRLRAQVRAYEQLDLPHESWDYHTLIQRAKFAAPAHGTHDAAPAAIRLPVAGALHPGMLLIGLAEHVLNLGGEIYENSPVASIHDGRPATVAVTEGGTVTAEHVVLATSGYGTATGVMKGRVLPVHLGVIATQPLEPSQFAKLGWPQRECAIDCRRIFSYFRPTEDNRIVFGGGIPRYRWGGDLRQSQAAKQSLQRLGRELFEMFQDAGQLRIAAAWTGVIGYVLDTMPTIRPLKDKSAVLFVGAWSGHGIALSIRSGEWVRELIDERRPPNDLPWFSHTPPWLPTELLRWCGFKIAVNGMVLLDKFSPSLSWSSLN